MKNIDLENYLIMIHKIYNCISNESFEKILNTEVSNFQEIYLLYLYELLKLICNRGLHRDYIKYEGVELNSPKGVINVQKSLENMTIIKGKLVCNYEELSYNNVYNQLIKCTINNIIKNKHISKNIINKYKQIEHYFNEVEDRELLDINTTILKNIKINNKYSQAIMMCENINSLNEPEQHKLKVFKEYIKTYYNDKLKTSKVYYKNVENTEYIIIESNKNIIILNCELYNDEEYRNLNTKIKELDKIIKSNFLDKTYKNVKSTFLMININGTYTDNDIDIYCSKHIKTAFTIIDTVVKHRYIEYKLNKLIDILEENKAYI